MSLVSTIMVRQWQATIRHTHLIWRNIFNESKVLARITPCQHCQLPHTRQLQTSTWLCIQHFHDKKPKSHIKHSKKKVTVHLRANMTVKQLAHGLKVSVDAVLESLQIAIGSFHYTSETDEIGNEKVLKKVAKMHDVEYQIVAKKVSTKDKKKETEEVKNKDITRQPPPDPIVLVSRSPIVTIMGHVDHGKTTLLDALRESNVVDQEFGGITQHIGAFRVNLPSGASITFLDTPGHAAFTSMRARGASVTDIIILVIAAEDGVMQQTLESIQHAQNANVPLIVAVNKIDKPGVDVEKLKHLLAQHDVIAEEFGGDVQIVPISALKKINLDILQECIVTQAELMELKADPKGKVEGSIVESRTHKGRGRLATAIIQRGTLRKGDLLIAGTTWARVRAMYNDQGGELVEAPPSTPVEISGWKDLPSAGDEILQVDSEKDIKQALEYRNEQRREEQMIADTKVIDEKRSKHNEEYNRIRTEKKTLGKRRMTNPCYLKWYKDVHYKEFVDHRDKPSFPIIIKGDVAGSIEAIVETLVMFKSDMCTLDIMEYGVGEVTEKDIQLAESFDGEIYAFNVPISANTAQIKHDVPIKQHKVIYSLFDDLVESITNKLPIKWEDSVLGEAKVLQMFTYTEKKKKIPVAGSRCIKGTLHRNKLYRVMRGETTIFEGELKSLKHHKNEVESIKAGMECGVSMNLLHPVEFKSNDIIICYEKVEVKQELDWQPEFR